MPFAKRFTILPAGRPGPAAARVEEVVTLDLGADNPLELVFVFITIGISLAIMVAFGQWWQR